LVHFAGCTVAAGTLGAVGLFAQFPDGKHQQADQKDDDCDGHQQFAQGKGGPSRTHGVNLAERTKPSRATPSRRVVRARRRNGQPSASPTTDAGKATVQRGGW
jgi:hypothetical protein